MKVVGLWRDHGFVGVFCVGFFFFFFCFGLFSLFVILCRRRVYMGGWG